MIAQYGLGIRCFTGDRRPVPVSRPSGSVHQPDSLDGRHSLPATVRAHQTWAIRRFRLCDGVWHDLQHHLQCSLYSP